MRNFIIVVIAILILLLIGLGLYATYRFVAEDAVATFTDTILFVMALVGLLIVLASVGMWTALRRILHEDIARKITSHLDRGSSVTYALKQLLGSKCQICGWKGFKKQDNSTFMEAHHLIQISERVQIPYVLKI